MSVKKLAIVLSHPVQYFSPLFRKMADSIDFVVLYGFQPTSKEQGIGFGADISWGTDLLTGYKYEFLNNISPEQTSSKFNGCDTPDIGEVFRKYEVTHVVTFGWQLKMYRQALRYCRKNKIPIAVRGDSTTTSNYSVIKAIAKKLYYPFFLSSYDAFLSVGKENRKYLKNYFVKDSKIIFSPHAVDQTFWVSTLESRKSTTFAFIWVAKFQPLKRPFDAIDAFLQEFRKDENVQLRMVGIGELHKKAMDKYSNEQQISFLGFKNQRELLVEYQGSNAILLTSDSETWGLVINEAFSVGIPAIVSDACGCSSDLIESGTGYIYKTGDIIDLRKKMRELYTNLGKPEGSQKMKSSISKKNETYSFRNIISSFTEFMLYN